MKKLMTIILGIAAAGCSSLSLFDGPDACAVSPDGHNEIRLWAKPLAYEVLRDGVVMVAKTPIGMKVNGACLCEGSELKAVVPSSASGSEASPVYKKAAIDLTMNETYACFGSWGVRLAARNDGVAYRFETKKPERIRVTCEKAQVTIPCPNARCQVNFTRSSGCEESVMKSLAAKEITTDKKAGFIYLPFVYTVAGKTVAVSESDVYDYPIWNLRRETAAEGPVTLTSEFARWPKTTKHVGGWGKEQLDKGGRWIRVTDSEDYLVETEGTRTFPWRTFVLADQPADLLSADLVRALARPANPTYDFSWVKPGKVAWDWWNAFDNIGDPQGCTTKTYLRFIDFAAKNGVEYVIMDEGWSKKLDIWNYSPVVDVPRIIEYANSKGVGIILWMAWAQIYGDEDHVASAFAKLGAKGFKVDFMDRGDAEAERFLWKFAEACRKNHMLIDYHGTHRPTGISRAYPNVLNFEGIHGLEQMKFYRGQDILGNDVRACFGRLSAGPMDYTPGAMDNYPVGKYPVRTKGFDPKNPINTNPGSLGTRARQMAMMALFEAPLQMLCDSPTKYEKNMESFRFMAQVPVVWANTVGLGGDPDSFAAVARQAKDGSWYAAGISDKSARAFSFSTAFLGSGDWKAEIFRDAKDSAEKATSYVHETRRVRAGERLDFDMAPGGGFVVRFVK